MKKQFSDRGFLYISLLLVPLLTACGPLSIRDAATGQYLPVTGGTLELHQDITFPSERTRVYFQSGERGPGVNEFQPHCQLEINTLKDTPQTIRADVFTITAVSTRTDQMVQSTSLHLAALAGFGFGGFFPVNGDSRESRHMLVYLFRLHSDQQPDVRQLVCGGAFDDPGLAKRPTLQEMAAALGTTATLTLH